jgi:hypothetical protein
MGYFLNLAAKLQKIAVKAKHIWKKGVQNKRFIPFVSVRNVWLLIERNVVTGRKVA